MRFSVSLFSYRSHGNCGLCPFFLNKVLKVKILLSFTKQLSGCVWLAISPAQRKTRGTLTCR